MFDMSASVGIEKEDNGLDVSLPEVSYVIEPFEAIDDEWFTRETGGKLNLSLSEDTLFGNASLRVDFSIGNRVDFGWIQQEKPHNCHAATHISFWYKSLVPQSLENFASLRFVLLDDSHCNETGGVCNDTGILGANLEHYYSVHNILDASNDGQWRELRIDLQGSDDKDSPMMLDIQQGSTGNGKLDVHRIRGWRFEFAPLLTERQDSTSTGTILLDQLACIGGGEMFGSSFYNGNDLEWKEAVADGMWIEEYYQSELSYNDSQVVLKDGIFSVDYTVQMVETWGGFMGFTYLAPGPAYYNLTGASDLHLGYHTRKAASVPGRTHLRIVVADGSHCTVNCSLEYWGHERWYSFNYILDDNLTNDGRGDIYLPFNGSTSPQTPFWLTGWSGEIGNSKLDISHIKGFTLELNIDSQGDVESYVTGAFDMFDLSAVSVENNQVDEAGSASSGRCVAETDLYIYENAGFFQRKEFLGSKCCETCEADPTCLYALSTGRDCYIASYIERDNIGILNTEILRRDLTAYWMDDVDRRGDFCDKCDCRESDQTIDCSDRDLLIVPKTFSPGSDWTPRVLDLSGNPKLVILGSGSLDAIGESLEELMLPSGIRHISPGSVKDLPSLRVVDFEKTEEMFLTNSIVGPMGAYADICCTRGSSVELEIPPAGMTFCEMSVKRPGVDSTYLPFIELPAAAPFKMLRPSSEFMSEAAESVEKCAEYCTISSECKYFSYDSRLPNAEHVCMLLENNGTGPFEVCCRAVSIQFPRGDTLKEKAISHIRLHFLPRSSYSRRITMQMRHKLLLGGSL